MAIQQTKHALETLPSQKESGAQGVKERDRQYLIEQHQLKSKGAAEEKIAMGLGLFSIGLGLAEALAPKVFARLIGAEGKHTALIRFMGLREIAAGVGILATRRPAGWVWARVAGDALDLALLGAAFASKDADKARLAAATAAVVGVTALDVFDAQKLATRPGPHGGMTVTKTITINRRPEELYRFWRNFENLPQFMSHLESVKVTGERTSHWVAKAPLGSTVEWDAEITEDRPNELIAWRSLEGSQVETHGTVRFTRAPGDRGTEVRAEVEYNPPGGALGAGIAKLFGEAPEQQIKGDLYRFKQVMETGEVVHSDASIHKGMHPGQPAANGKEQQ